MNRTQPISQIDIEKEMMRLLDMLEKETENFEILAVDAAKKDARYKAEWAKEYLGAAGKGHRTITDREQWSHYKMEQMNEDYEIAEALVRAKREKLLSLRTSIDALRTLNANVRAQVEQ